MFCCLDLWGYYMLSINQKRYKTTEGKMGLVHVGKVTGKSYQRSLHEGQCETYGNGKAYWSIGIPTDANDSTGFVSREKVLSILGHKPNYYFRGYARGAGVKIIDDSQAHKLLQQFNG